MSSFRVPVPVANEFSVAPAIDIVDAQYQQSRDTSQSPELVRYSGPPIYYADVNMDWNGVGDDLIVFDVVAVREKIMNVLGIVPGEEHFEPTFGSELPYRVFEPVNANTEYDLEFDVITTLTNQMSTVITVLHSQCSVTQLTTGLGEGYMIQIAYVINRIQKLDRFRYRLLRS